MEFSVCGHRFLLPPTAGFVPYLPRSALSGRLIGPAAARLDCDWSLIGDGGDAALGAAIPQALDSGIGGDT